MKKVMIRILKKNKLPLDPQLLKCQTCEHTEPIPEHCMKSMHIERIEEKNQLICWMGASCGVLTIPRHHDSQMKIVIKEK